MCGICKHPGPQQVVALCVVQCERCRQEVRAQRDAGQPAL